MNLNLNGRRALITGSTAGLGEATARLLAATMAKPAAGKQIGVSSFLADNAVIGVGMVLLF
ncbi:hypothetical protein AB0J67_38170, partial [Catellatospora sp. NPDC049609]